MPGVNGYLLDIIQIVSRFLIVDGWHLSYIIQMVILVFAMFKLNQF